MGFVLFAVIELFFFFLSSSSLHVLLFLYMRGWRFRSERYAYIYHTLHPRVHPEFFTTPPAAAGATARQLIAQKWGYSIAQNCAHAAVVHFIFLGWHVFPSTPRIKLLEPCFVITANVKKKSPTNSWENDNNSINKHLPTTATTASSSIPRYVCVNSNHAFIRTAAAVAAAEAATVQQRINLLASFYGYRLLDHQTYAFRAK